MQSLDSILDDRKHSPDCLHPVQVEVVGKSRITPLHSYENHIRRRRRQCAQATAIKTDAEIDQLLEGLESLRAVKEGVPMELGGDGGGVLRRKNPGNPLHVQSELRNIFRWDQSNGKPVSLAPYIRLVYVAEQHALPRTSWR